MVKWVNAPRAQQIMSKSPHKQKSQPLTPERPQCLGNQARLLSFVGLSRRDTKRLHGRTPAHVCTTAHVFVPRPRFCQLEGPNHMMLCSLWARRWFLGDEVHSEANSVVSCVCVCVSRGGGRLQPVLMPHPPQLSVKTWGGGGGGGGVGWRVCVGGGGGVGWRVWGGGVGRRVWGGGSAGAGGFPRWGGLHATHYYHMHTSREDVCLGRVRGSCWWLL